LAFSYSCLFSCSRKYIISGKLASEISMFDRINVEMGFTTFPRFEFGSFGGIIEKGDIVFRVCSGHWLMNSINLLKKGRRDKNEISMKMR
jgi:hypothetical protein